METAKDIELLRLEMATLWERDAYGRLGPEPLVAVAVARDGQAVRLGSALPRHLMLTEGDPLPAGTFFGSQPPPILDAYQERLAALGPLRIEGGPSYVFSEVMEILPSSLAVFVSDEVVPPILAALRPEPWWEPQEWSDLLAGRLGPWAMGVKGNRVASLCHTPVGSSEAAEAGIWTHPEERGRGCAMVATSAWAKVARYRFGTLFYSTSAENLASQSVARKLGLMSIGWIWQLKAN